MRLFIASGLFVWFAALPAGAQGQPESEKANDEPVVVEEISATSVEPVEKGVAVPKQKDLPSVSRPDLPRISTATGTVGLHRLEAARGWPEGRLGIGFGLSMGTATDFLVKEDEHTRQSQFVTVAWTPIDSLELFFSQYATANRNAAFIPASIQSAGDPRLGLKYSYPVTEELGLALALRGLIPTSEQGTGLDPGSMRIATVLAASFLAAPWLDLSVNAGYTYDNTGALFADKNLGPSQRFAAGTAYTDSVTTGLGLVFQQKIGEEASFRPFLETSMEFGLGVPMEENPIIVTLGGALFGGAKMPVEIIAGVDIAASGLPVPDGKLPGIMPWEVFGRLVAHVGVGGDTTQVFVEAQKPTCAQDSECASGLACVANECVKVVVNETVKVESAPTFTITGKVVDNSGAPVESATVSISGSESSPLAVDPKTGEFRSFPVASGEGLLQVSSNAPGFEPATQTLPRGRGGEVKKVDFALQPYGKKVVGEVRGTIKDARSGNPVDARVVVPLLNRTIKSSAGAFNASLKAGQYQILISAKGYVTQKKQIRIEPREVVILNIDLVPER